jgi:hypothetical protein
MTDTKELKGLSMDLTIDSWKVPAIQRRGSPGGPRYLLFTFNAFELSPKK